MLPRWLVIACSCVSLSLFGCSLPTEEEPEVVSEGAAAVNLSATSAAAILAFVNYPGTDLTTLDKEVGLDARAAKGVAAHRNGPDGVSPSADDDLFDSIAELDAVPYVGEAAFAKLDAYAATHPAPAGEVVEGVTFNGWQVEAVVHAVNQQQTGVLKSVGLTSTAANNLVAAAPFSSVAAMGAVAYVGPSALGKLRDAAPSFWHAMKTGAPTGQGGTYDGVAFDDATAAVALEIAQAATQAQLESEGKMWSTGAKRIVEGRPYASLKAVADAYGVGTATMQSLKDYATSGAWQGPAGGGTPATCELTSATQTSHPTVTDYATQLAAFDDRDEFYEYRIGVYSVPTCIDPTSPATTQALRGLLVKFAGWEWMLPEFAHMFEYGNLVAGPSDLQWIVDGSLSHMDEFRADRVADGDENAQTQFDALKLSHGKLVQLIQQDAGQSWSLGIRIEASECSEKARLMVNTKTGLVIAMHQPPQC